MVFHRFISFVDKIVPHSCGRPYTTAASMQHSIPILVGKLFLQEMRQNDSLSADRQGTLFPRFAVGCIRHVCQRILKWTK
jgi:hypothetical protein